MKTSIQWLKEYIDFDNDPRELAEQLTLAGLEVEGIFPVVEVPEGIVVGEILTREPHPDADKLSVCTVSVGADEPLQIVCGAPNCDAGNRVPVATVGTQFDEKFVIKKTKLRGVKSAGMMCSSRELGLGNDHDGLMILPEDAKVGTPLGDTLELDVVIDWEVTPNRPDWLSHYGIAREIAAVTSRSAELKKADVTVTENSEKVEDYISVDVQDTDLCPRYIARVVKNVKIGPSPQWMQDRLMAVGIRPINNVVDITNYVLYEVGQPLHAFDYDLLKGKKIIVRRAQDGEMMKTLDDKEHKLNSENLLIADAERGVALAGVMGGGNTEINDETTNVLIESAAFFSSNIRATAKQLSQHSDSSHRFERGVDIEGTEYASLRAVQLLCDLAGGELVGGSVDVYPAKYEAHQVSCRYQRARDLIGMDIENEFMIEAFKQLGFEIVFTDDELFTVGVPSYRLDITREADMVEEVARLYGLDNIVASVDRAGSGGMICDDTYYFAEEQRAQFRSLGLDETMTYTLMSAETATQTTGLSEDDLVQLANPLSAESAIVRPSIIPCVLQTVAHNIAHNNENLALFELGTVAVKAKVEERNQAVLAMTGLRYPERYAEDRKLEVDFFDLKGVLENWLEINRLYDVKCVRTEHPTFVEGKTAAFVINEKEVAVVGEVKPEFTKHMRLKYPLFMAVVEVDLLKKIKADVRNFTPLPQYPSTERAISLVADSTLTSQEVIDVILASKNNLLESVELVDLYEDEKNLGKGKRSLTFSLIYRDQNQTLTDKKVNKSHDKIRGFLQKKLNVELR